MWCRALTVKDTGGQCGLYELYGAGRLQSRTIGEGQCGLCKLCGAGR